MLLKEIEVFLHSGLQNLPIEDLAQKIEEMHEHEYDDSLSETSDASSLDEILNDGAGDQKMIPTYGYNPYIKGHGAFIYPIASLICTPPGR